MDSPTTRTLAECRAKGWRADVAEYWQPSFAARQVVDAATLLAESRSAEHLDALHKAVGTLRQVGPGKRQDLFDFIDVVAVGDGQIIAIQTTSTSGQGARYIKIVAECAEAAQAWLAAGGKIFIVGWKKYAQPVERKYWRSTWREVTAEDFRPKTKPF